MTHPHFKAAQARVGSQARKWTLDHLIDVGGMAAVFAGTHRNGNRVAIKVLHEAFAKMEEAKERFLREGYVANKVGHIGAVTVLDDDELDDGTPFLVMELLEGNSLEGHLKQRGVLSLQEALFIGDHVLDVLAAAHDNGIIHRDIKPGNIFLTNRGEAKVLDFGLARILEAPGQMSMTRTGTIIGTAGYMSPEQARGRRSLIDHRTDIYAVGAMLFRALTGRVVHIADTSVDRLLLAMTEHAPSLATLLPDAPEDLVGLLDRALAFQKEDRWPNASAMQQSLRKVFQRHQGGPQTAPRPPPPASGWSEASEQASADRTLEDIHVSVVFEEQSGGDSIFVEFEDLDSGDKQRRELRRVANEGAPSAGKEAAPLSEVTIEMPKGPPRR